MRAHPKGCHAAKSHRHIQDAPRYSPPTSRVSSSGESRDCADRVGGGSVKRGDEVLPDVENEAKQVALRGVTEVGGWSARLLIATG